MNDINSYLRWEWMALNGIYSYLKVRMNDIHSYLRWEWMTCILTQGTYCLWFWITGYLWDMIPITPPTIKWNIFFYSTSLKRKQHILSLQELNASKICFQINLKELEWRSHSTLGVQVWSLPGSELSYKLHFSIKFTKMIGTRTHLHMQCSPS